MAALHEAPGIPAIELAHALAPEAGERYLLVRMAGADYGIPLEQLGGVERVGQVATVPHAPSWLWGLTHLHGQVLPVVDLAAFLGLGATPRDNTARLILARHEVEGYAFTVERTGRITRILPAQLRAADKMLAGLPGAHLRGVWLPDGQQAVPLLELAHVAHAVGAWFEAEGWDDEDHLAAGS